MPKKEPSKSFMLRLDAKVMAAVEKWATDEFRSTNGQLQWIITEALRKNRRLPKRSADKDNLDSPNAETESAGNTRLNNFTTTKPTSNHNTSERTLFHQNNNMELIKNELLSIEISDLGAELQSIKDTDGKEYLWQGDPDFWPRRSPILFPIVCGLWEDTYRLNGKTYKLGRHGFARDTQFKLIAQGPHRVTYALSDTPETFADYPFHFNMSVSYKLCDNQLHVIWHVENTDDKPIYFQIGGHPAFFVPGQLPNEPLKGSLRFDCDNPIRIYANVGGCIDKGKHREVETHDGVWEFTEESFKEDAVIFDHSQIRRIELLNPNGKPEVTLDFKTPAVGIWSPYGKNAPFVCIEPWYGIADWANFEGEFCDKHLMNQLLPGASFMSQYTITIG